MRESVYRAALTLLAEEGFAGVRLPDVARRAHVNKTTVYRRWASPAELLRDALADFAALALPEVDTGCLEGDVEAFLRSRLRLIRDPTAAGILRAVITSRSADSALASWVDRFWKLRRDQWTSPIDRAIARGELRPSARDVPFIDLVVGPLIFSHMVSQRKPPAREIQSIADILSAGLRAGHGID